MNLYIRLDLPSHAEPLIFEWRAKTIAWLYGKTHNTLVRARKYYQRAKQRRALRELDYHQLKDIGLSRIDALQEANKPFWKE